MLRTGAGIYVAWYVFIIAIYFLDMGREPTTIDYHVSFHHPSDERE